MIKHTSLALAFSLFAAGAAADTSRTDHQNTASIEGASGFFSGLVVGGAAGGPPGALIGAAFGALLGEGFYARSEEVADLQVNLYESQLQVAAAQQESQRLARRFQLAQQELDNLRVRQSQIIPAALPTLSSPCCDNTVVSLHFRTGSSNIESHYEEQLSGLVEIAKQMPTARVEITGYADRNGNPDLNLNLSRERSDTVKRFFNRMGVQNSSIQTIAYGETKPLQPKQDMESDFFDRRVIVRVRDSSKQMLSQSPDHE